MSQEGFRDLSILRLAQLCVSEASSTVVESCTCLATLWAGMGKIYRVDVRSSGDTRTLIIKHITFPVGDRLSIGDARKVVSYDVEANFYENFSAEINVAALYCIVPACVYVDRAFRSAGILSICMQPLPGPAPALNTLPEVEAAIRAIATLHSQWFGPDVSAKAVMRGVQSQGGYWYLDTRPDEFDAMPTHGWEGRLRMAASAIDERLKADPCQCLIHGDLKKCNMAISNNKCDQLCVSFCDFQYFGRSCAMKDLAYFFTTNLEEIFLQRYEQHLITLYRHTLSALNPSLILPPPVQQLSESLDIAYADLCRWMSGWGYWGCVGFLQRRVQRVLDRLDGGKALKTSEEYSIAVRRIFAV